MGSWAGQIADTRSDTAPLSVVSVLQPRAAQGGSQPALVLASDGRQYWIKPLDNPQGDRVPVTEQVVARCGHLIDAPTCAVTLLRIPEELEGEPLAGSRVLQQGITHGSLNVPSVDMVKRLEHRARDDNADRQAGVYALHDWCWGNDGQWLYDSTDDMRMFSHDHGHFLPGGPRWSVAALQGDATTPHSLDIPTTGIPADALREAADRVEAVTQADLVGILQGIPASWPVPDADLEALGEFLDGRRGAVAARLRQIPSGK